MSELDRPRQFPDLVQINGDMYRVIRETPEGVLVQPIDDMGKPEFVGKDNLHMIAPLENVPPLAPESADIADVTRAGITPIEA